MTAGGRGGGQPADGLAEGIARLRRALRRGARVADPGNTLAVAQLELLAALAEQPGARPGQLARKLNMRANTVTTIVNALSARGMLRRDTADDDRRAVKLTVTESGRQAVLAWGRPPTRPCCTWRCLPCRPASGAPSRPPRRRSTPWPPRSTSWPIRRERRPTTTDTGPGMQPWPRFPPRPRPCPEGEVTTVTGTMGLR